MSRRPQTDLKAKARKANAKVQALQQEVRVLEKVPKARGPKRQSAPGGGRGKANHLSDIRDLLNSRHLAEIYWLKELANPWTKSKTRVPITVVSGPIPCDLYTVEAFGSAVVNASGTCFVTYEADKWQGNQILGINGANGKPMLTTNASFVGVTSPAVGSVAAGVAMVTLPDVSPDITNAATGTEYMFVAGGAYIKPNSSLTTAGNWYGELYVIETDDPERYPLTGTTLTALRTLSMAQGSSVRVTPYRITANGRFVPTELAMVNEEGTVLDTGSVGMIGVSAFPLTVSAFEWQRVNGTPVATVQEPTVMFQAVGCPASAIFDCGFVSNYQLERYPTARVGAKLGGQTTTSDTGELMQSLGGMAQQVLSGTGNAGLAKFTNQMVNHLPAGMGFAYNNILSKPGAGASPQAVAAWVATQADKNPGLINQLAGAASSAWDSITGHAASSASISGAIQGGGNSISALPASTPSWVELIPEVELAIEEAAPLLLTA